MMRRILLASAFAVCAATPVLAAPTASATNWGGFYAGVNAGFGGDKFSYPVNGTYADVVEDVDTDITSLHGTASQTASGALGGGQVGYNYQAANGWVLGLEADIDGSGVEGRTALSGAVTGDIAGGASGHISSKIDYFGTVRVRAGMPLADGRFLPYVTGGFAYGQTTSSAALSVTPDGGSTTSLSASRHLTRTGWTAGVGADYALTDRLSFRAEYLYVDLGTKTLLGGSTDVGDGVLSGKIGLKATANIMRVGVNYRFGR
jgi:outer membrane immunogenic protein